MLKPGTSAYAEAFEHWVIVEIYRRLKYARLEFDLSYLLTKDGAKIDLILSNKAYPTILIEIKSSDRIHQGDVRPLRHFANDFKPCQCYLFSRDPVAQSFDPNIQALPWEQGISQLLKTEKLQGSDP